MMSPDDRIGVRQVPNRTFFCYPSAANIRLFRLSKGIMAQLSLARYKLRLDQTTWNTIETYQKGSVRHTFLLIECFWECGGLSGKFVFMAWSFCWCLNQQVYPYVRIGRRGTDLSLIKFSSLSHMSSWPIKRRDLCLSFPQPSPFHPDPIPDPTLATPPIARVTFLVFASFFCFSLQK